MFYMFTVPIYEILAKLLIALNSNEQLYKNVSFFINIMNLSKLKIIANQNEIKAKTVRTSSLEDLSLVDGVPGLPLA